MAPLNSSLSYRAAALSVRGLRQAVSLRSFGLSSVSGITDVVAGTAVIEQLQPALIALSERCDQRGAMDHLPYFLSCASALKKTPHLVLLGATLEQALASPTRLQGALLIFEYRLLGWSTRIFATDDTTGRRTLLAPAASRPQTARLAIEALMRRGAAGVLLNIAEPGAQQSKSYLQAAPSRPQPGGPATPWRVTTRLRQIPSFLPLEATFDKTLARIGQRTRSNLRYYRRRAEAQLGCIS